MENGGGGATALSTYGRLDRQFAWKFRDGGGGGVAWPLRSNAVAEIKIIENDK